MFYYGVPNESKLHHQSFISLSSFIPTSNIILDVRYTISDFQYHIRRRICYIRLPISYWMSDILYPFSSDVVYTISNLQYHIGCLIYYIHFPISYQTSYILYPTSNIILDVWYTLSILLIACTKFSEISDRHQNR